jgi:hypothetical protein
MHFNLELFHVALSLVFMVVIKDGLGDKDVQFGHNKRMDVLNCHLGNGRVQIKIYLYAKIHFYVLSQVVTVG